MNYIQNSEGYNLFLKLEILIREVIIENFDKAFESEDWCRRNGPLGNDVNEEACSRCGKTTNLSIPQKIELQKMDLMKKGWDYDSACSTHGIYFLLFTDLTHFFKRDKDQGNKNPYILGNKKIKVFETLNNTKIDALIAQIEQLYSIRNKIAHSSLINERELGILTTTLNYCEHLFCNVDKYYQMPIKRHKIISSLRLSIKVLSNHILEYKNICNTALQEYQENSNFTKYLVDFNSNQFNSILDKYISFNKQTGSFTRIKELVKTNSTFLNTLNEKIHN
jgi:hypothetical protein